MHGVELSERVIAVQRELITAAEVALKGGHSGERLPSAPPGCQPLWNEQINPRAWRSTRDHNRLQQKSRRTIRH
jgi:hypothetical protein